MAKCDEIEKQLEFIESLAAKAQDPNWELNDPGHSHMRAVYNSARSAIVTLTGELPPG